MQLTNKAQKLPFHVAIIMDGNNRWAKKQNLSGVEGHQKGVARAREAVEFAVEKKISTLTLFAFSSENWDRPKKEVSLLMKLLTKALEDEVPNLKKNHVRLKFIGDIDRFDEGLKTQMKKAEIDTNCSLSEKNLDLVIAASYGGQWDILQALKSIKDQNLTVSEKNIAMLLSTWGLDHPYPDLCIRTGGEYRISNFYLWQLAYSELYFTEFLWPDFDSDQFQLALKEYSKRNRRFGDQSNFEEI